MPPARLILISFSDILDGYGMGIITRNGYRIQKCDCFTSCLSGGRNYGIGSTHNFKKEIEDTLRPLMERETRGDMHNEPPHEVVNKEIAYRWSQETSAMGKLTNDELEMVYKTGIKPSEYLANK